MARFASLIVVVLYNFFLSFLSVFFWIVSTCPSHSHRLRWLATLLPAFHVCKASAQFSWCDWCSTNTISFHHSMFDILPIPWSILQVFPSHIQWCLRNESLVVLNVIQTCGLLNFDPIHSDPRSCFDLSYCVSAPVAVLTDIIWKLIKLHLLLNVLCPVSKRYSVYSTSASTW